MTPVSPVGGEVDVARLREVAEAAEKTTGAWKLRHSSEFRHDHDRGLYGKYGYVIRPGAHAGMFNDDASAEHIATFDPPTVLALIARLEAAESRHRDLVSRLGFGDNITEPMADNDTIVAWFEERGREADEWRESQRWRDECHLAGHPDDEDCYEHDPARRLEAAESARDEALAVAYDDGYNDAVTMARVYGHTDHWPDEDEPRNPYRAALTPSEATP